MQSTKYTATFNGNGNNIFIPSFPQYSPPGGYALVSAVLQSNVSITASWQMTNNGLTTATVKPGVTSEDSLQLNSKDITDGAGVDIGDVLILKNAATSYTIAPGATVTAGPTAMFTNTPVFTAAIDTIYTNNTLLNKFNGTGTAPLSYVNTAGYMLSGAGASTVTVVPSFAVTINLSLKYYYCYTGPLAMDIVTFTATRENEQKIALNWITTNEHAGRKYIVEVSPGGGSGFSELATQPSDPVNNDASYSYSYIIKAADKGKLHFRLKLVDIDGAAAYSPLRIIDLGAGAVPRFSIYPNPPSDFINLSFPSAGTGWQVDILAADGKLVQRNQYYNTGTVRVNFQHKLSAGAYFVRATDQQTAKNYVSSFVIR